MFSISCSRPTAIQSLRPAVLSQPTIRRSNETNEINKNSRITPLLGENFRANMLTNTRLANLKSGSCGIVHFAKSIARMRIRVHITFENYSRQKKACPLYVSWFSLVQKPTSEYSIRILFMQNCLNYRNVHNFEKMQIAQVMFTYLMKNVIFSLQNISLTIFL